MFVNEKNLALLSLCSINPKTRWFLFLVCDDGANLLYLFSLKIHLQEMFKNAILSKAPDATLYVLCVYHHIYCISDGMLYLAI